MLLLFQTRYARKTMTKFEKWFIKRVIRKEVKQSDIHALNIRNLYSMIREACENEFTEDNDPTLNSFLKEQFERTQK